MTELCRHIGPNTDVPAGDIGVGGREIGYMYGQYKRLRNEFTGVLTGKGLNWGGSLIRPEATGYGCVYFCAEMLATRNQTLEGKICLVSGSGNVSQYTIEKILQLGGKVVTVSDSDGYIYDEEGIDAKKLAFIMDLKNVKRGRIKTYAEKYRKAVYTPIDRSKDYNPLWDHKADCAFPSATQNEINAKDARNLLKNGIYVVGEGANMPTHFEGVRLFLDAKDPVWSGKGSQCGRRCGFRPRNGTEQHAASLDEAGSRQSFEPDHEEHPYHVRGMRRPVWDSGQLCQWSQHRRIPQGCGCHDGSRPRIDRRSHFQPEGRIRGSDRATAPNYGLSQLLSLPGFYWALLQFIGTKASIRDSDTSLRADLHPHSVLLPSGL